MDATRGLRADFCRRSLLKATGAAAIGLSFSGREVASAANLSNGEEPKLNFYNWDTYIGETTLDDFKAESGVDVQMDLFATNDELMQKLQRGNSLYDVIVPSNDYIGRMVQEKLLQPLDHELIPNFRNISPEFRDAQFDPRRQFSMPYTFLVLGIGYRKSKVKSVPDSWRYILDSSQYSRRIGVLNDATAMFQIYAKYLGKSVDALSPADIAAIENKFKKQRRHIKMFHDDDGQDLLLEGAIDLVVEYNGDIAAKMIEDSDIDFVMPKEGSIVVSDGLCIPKGAQHVKNAHAFINHLLSADAGKKLAETIRYPSPNVAARALMPAPYNASSVIFPSKAALAKCSYSIYDPVTQKLCEAAFARVRAS